MLVIAELGDRDRERHVVKKLPKSIVVQRLRQLRKIGYSGRSGMGLFTIGHMLQQLWQIAVFTMANRPSARKFPTNQAVNRVRASMTGWWA
ncbi:hypothetical protein D3C71_1296060 [compost metagenome]